jgi:hypothetical protein
VYGFAKQDGMDIPTTPKDTPIGVIDLAPGVHDGVSPYTFTITGTAPNILPSGVTMTSEGIISGTPDTVEPYGNVEFSVTDNGGQVTYGTILKGAIT